MSIRHAMSWLPLVSMLLLMAVVPQVSAADGILPGVIVETNANSRLNVITYNAASTVVNDDIIYSNYYCVINITHGDRHQPNTT